MAASSDVAPKTLRNQSCGFQSAVTRYWVTEVPRVIPTSFGEVSCCLLSVFLLEKCTCKVESLDAADCGLLVHRVGGLRIAIMYY